MKAAVIVPTNRPERMAEFVRAWEPQFLRPDVRLLVVEDHPMKEFELPAWVEHYCHEDFAELGERASCIPTRSGGCRSYGIWAAAQDKALDMIVSLDDDCLPLDGGHFLGGHWGMLANEPRVLRWWKVAPDYTRGFPYGLRAGILPVLNHGLWAGVPDLDAITQLHNPDQRFSPTNENEAVPWGSYFPMCAMNVAFRPIIAPIMYFPPMPDGMRRWDDIWGGIVAKKICDAHGWPVASGFPCVQHLRASNVWANLRQEWMGYELNEHLWQVVDGAPIGGVGILEDYCCIARRIWSEFPELGGMAKAMLDWAGLW